MYAMSGENVLWEAVIFTRSCFFSALRTSHPTLYFYNNEPSKNKHFLILLSNLARNSQEPKLKRIFEILWVLFEKISVFYSDWPKSWIWRTLGHVRIILCKFHLHNASKEVSRPNFFWIPCRGSKVPFWQFFNSGKMALLNPCMEFKKKICRKTSFEGLWRWHLEKIFLTCPRVSQFQNLGNLE